MFHLDDSMANVCIYGIAMAANVLANRWKRSPNIFSIISFTVLH